MRLFLMMMVFVPLLYQVDHGAKLLRSTIENFEQLVRANWASGGSSSNGAGSSVQHAETFEGYRGERRQGLQTKASGRSSADRTTADEHSRVDAAQTTRKRMQPDTNESDEENERKRIQRNGTSAADSGASSRLDEITDKSEDLDIDEFRIRLQRSAAVSRRIATEAAQAQARMVVEKQKYVSLLRRAEAMKHKRRVSDLIVKAQCAVIASPGSFSTQNAKKKRVKIEQLSSAHDACWQNPTFRHVVAPDIRIQRLRTRKLSLFPLPVISGHTVKSALMDDDLANLFKQIEAFKKVTSSSAAKDRTPIVQENGHAAPSENVSDTSASIPPSLSTVQGENRVAPAPSARAVESQRQENRRESFRSTWDVPGLTRDLNLVQDYTEESECKLLRFIVGQRQYFYMEPLLLNHGMESPDALKRWILSERDVALICRYLSDSDQFGKKLVDSIAAARSEAATSSASSGMFRSSKTVQWSAVQRQFVELHSLTLAAHLLGYHYHAMHALSGAVRTDAQKPADSPSSDRDLLDDETLKSDLFKYILRPIRSSAIESSLLDSLPISLVRETVEHCPEVLNHVLNWKDEEDIPTDLPQDIRDAKAAHGNSTYLQDLMDRLSTHLSELSLVVTSLGETARRQLQRHEETSKDRDKVIFLTNQLKSVMANVVLENINLQLHKWATVFLENSCSWFDSDFEDSSVGYGSDGDRTYDKFTCLQDALFVWHNKKVLYSAKDDLADIEETKSSISNGNAAEQPSDSPAPSTSRNGLEDVVHQDSHPTASEAMASGRNPSPQAISSAGRTASTSDRDGKEALAVNRAGENELLLLKRLTPGDMLDKMENHFALSDISKYLMSGKRLSKLRTQLFESLYTMKALMDVMGRSAPWRTHVKHSNALKRELAKQADIEKRLILNQWAFFYNRHKGRVAKKSGLPDPLVKESDMDIEAKHADPDEEKREEGGGSEAKAAMEIDWTGVFDANDSAEVVEMKKLRHELQVANSELVKSATGGGESQDSLDADHKALMEECNALTRSCVAALSKFLGESVDTEVASQIQAASESAATTPRRRARSRSVVHPGESIGSASSAVPATTAPVDDCAGEDPSRSHRSSTDTLCTSALLMTDDAMDGGAGEGSGALSVSATQKTRRPRSLAEGGSSTERSAADRPHHTVSGQGSAAVSAVSSSGKQSPASGASSASTSPTPQAAPDTKASRSTQLVGHSTRANPAPLRMGCSGCRDLRRRCTGCFGCCLHCVCVSCGCRMCCSTRFSAVQKTLSMLVSCVEANDGCKWVHPKPRSNSLSSDAESSSATGPPQFTSRICGMLRICFKCLYCGTHCTCVRPSASGHVGFGLRGKAGSGARKQRRFKAKPASAQRRTSSTVGEGVAPNDPEASTTPPHPGDPSPRSRRSATPATTATPTAPGSTPASVQDPDIFSIPLPQRAEDVVPPPPRKDQGKNEQEDLFRAARVRMKLQRNTFSKLHTLYGSLPPNTLLDGEMLWQPERIRMMWERKDFFGVLGVPRDATTQQIKRQYRKLALKLHPDKTLDVAHSDQQHGSGDGSSYTSSTADERVEAFVAVTHSYKLLSGDPSAANSSSWKPAL